MKLSALCFSLILLSTASVAADQDIKAEGVRYIKMLGGTLKSELKSRMKEDPSGVAAAGFCAGSAEDITKKVNSKLPKYANVRRTSLKVRNPDNKPDALDEKVMKEFAEAIKHKTLDPKNPVRVVQDGDTARVYKPLLTKKVCLKCHGSDLSPEISKIIKEHYPNDHATGFKEGDLRGVIVAEIKKH